MAGLRITIKGFAKCEFTEHFGRNSTTYEQQEDYLNFLSYLFGTMDGEPKKIEAGVYTYRFSCFLPLELPYSVEAAHGYIRYKVEVNLDIPWGFDDKKVERITILSHDDLNLYPDLKMPCQDEDLGSLCCRFYETDPPLLEASIPYSGYTCGDTINVAIKVINDTNEILSGVKIELLRRTKFVYSE